MGKCKLKIGILGCGPIAQFAHLEACQKAENVVLHSVCDQAEELAHMMGSFYGAKNIYTSYDEMLADKELEAVIIATADTFHISASLQAVSAGKHVLVEKPLGKDLSEAEKLKTEVDRSGLLFQIGHMKRFDPGIAYAKSFIKEDIGEIVAFKAWYCDSTHRYQMTDSTQPVPVRSDKAKKLVENAKYNPYSYNLLAHGSHLVDLARFLVGTIESVQARLVEKKGILSWFIDTEFTNGANGHLDLTIAVRMDWHEGFQIYGEKGSVMGKIYNPWYFKTSEVQCFLEKDRIYRQPLDNRAHFFQLQLQSFAEAILKGYPQIGTNITEGLHSIKTLLAIAQSVKTGQRVALEQVSGSL